MISVLSQEGHARVGVYEYVIDTVAELSNVPTDVHAGSMVYCIENSKKYMLNNTGTYVEVNFKKGGSGGGSEISPFFHKQVDVPNTTSTTPTVIEEVQLPDEWIDDKHILYFISRYVGTVPNHHYVGSEVVGVHVVYSTDSFAFGGYVMRIDANGQIIYANNSAMGVFPKMSDGKLYLYYNYSTNATSAIDGTYDIKIYMVPKPIPLS